MSNVLQGYEPAVTTTHPHTQVYQATHDGAGARLPLMSRAFISFTWGGRAIEDFGTISVSDGSRYNRGAYSSFEDIATPYEVIDGQHYWGTHFVANEITFSLATDGILERQYLDFQNWFRPGIARELILAEHPNRVIMARVAEVPNFSFVPFKEQEKITINGIDYYTDTIKYKGELSLKFVMDDPLWEGKKVIIDEEEQKYEDDPTEVITLEDKDYLKIIAEDGIPHVDMIDFTETNTIILADNYYVTDDARIGGRVAADDSQSEGGTNSDVTADDATPEQMIAQENVNEAYIGIYLSGLQDAPNGFSLGRTGSVAVQKGYLYYAGNAPSKVASLKFSTNIRMYTSSSIFTRRNFIITPYNRTYDLLPDASSSIIANFTTNYVVNTAHNGFSQTELVPHTTIWVGDEQFHFSLPNFLYSYNKALSILMGSKVDNNKYSNYIEIQEKIKLEVAHPVVRKWALNCIDLAKEEVYSYSNNQQLQTILQDLMAFLFAANKPSKYTTNDNPPVDTICYSFLCQSLYTPTFEFNSITGETKGTFTYNQWPASVSHQEDALASDDLIAALFSLNDTIPSLSILTITEDVGDMIVGKFLEINRDYTPLNASTIGISDCLFVASNAYIGTNPFGTAQGLFDVTIKFKNKYY